MKAALETCIGSREPGGSWLWLSFVSAFACCLLAVAGEDASKPNVLMIVVDDLRTALGCYGDALVSTPNIDNLAKKSVLFQRAYAQQALCGPSRASFLTGRRPDTTRIYDERPYRREAGRNFTTLPQHFKENGYFTQSVGKVFHPGKTEGNFTDDYPHSWSALPYHPSSEQYRNAKACPGEEGQLHQNLVCPVTVSETPEATLPDIQTSDFAVQFLSNRTSQPGQPFFLAVGLHKPHIPLKYPKEYLDLYPLSEMHLASNPTYPLWLPLVAWNPWTDLRQREDVKALNVSFPFGPLPAAYQLKLRQSYYAAVSYMDAQVGKILAALDQNGFAANTVITFLSDHGWALGEHQEWAKYSNFEVATRVPLMIYIPGLTTRPATPGTTFPFHDVIANQRFLEAQSLREFSVRQRPFQISSQMMSRLNDFRKRRRRREVNRDAEQGSTVVRKDALGRQVGSDLNSQQELRKRSKRKVVGDPGQSSPVVRKYLLGSDEDFVLNPQQQNTQEFRNRNSRQTFKDQSQSSTEVTKYDLGEERSKNQNQQHLQQGDTNELHKRRQVLNDIDQHSTVVRKYALGGEPSHAQPPLSLQHPPQPLQQRDAPYPLLGDPEGWREIFRGNVLPFVTRIGKDAYGRRVSQPVAALKYRLSLHIDHHHHVKAPKSSHEYPFSTQDIVELVDLFPTLSELAGLAVPSLCPENPFNVSLCTEGSSLAPLINDLTASDKMERLQLLHGETLPGKVWNKPAFSQTPRPSVTPQVNSDKPELQDISIMGYSMRTSAHRYTEWVGFDPSTFHANWSDVYAKELYLHETDPKEDQNVAHLPENTKLVDSLSEKLRKGWRFSVSH